jgi:hypothetical protein
MRTKISGENQKNHFFQTLLIFWIAGLISNLDSGAQSPLVSELNTSYRQVKVRTNASSPTWNTYAAKTIELLKSKACVGWYWFTYQDNDPLNLKTDPSNRDSNKGMVNSNFEPYQPLIDNMKLLNDHVFELIQFLDKE